MKRLIALCLAAALYLGCLSSCGILGFHSISYPDSETEGLLMDGYALKWARGGDTVVLRAHVIEDAHLELYANDEKLTLVHLNTYFGEYVFTMPNEDVVITHKVVDGTLPKRCDEHYDDDGDGACDGCGYGMSIDIPPAYFIREQAGYEWLYKITADDIAEVKMISGGGGPLPPVSFTHISSSVDKAVISSIFTEYFWLDSTPVYEEETQIADGGYFIVQFILNDGTVEQIYFLNGDFYCDSDDNYFEIHRLPVFRDGTNFVNYYGFERSYQPCEVYLADGTFLCEIPRSEFEFIGLTDDIYLGGEVPDRYIEMNGERLYFIRDCYFYIGDGRSGYYQLVGKNLDELISEYSQK